MRRVGIYSIEYDWENRKVSRVLVGIAEFMSPIYAQHYAEVGNSIITYDSEHYQQVSEPGHTFRLEPFTGKQPESLNVVLTCGDCRLAQGESRLFYGDYENNAVTSLDSWISTVQDFMTLHPRLDLDDSIAIIG